MHESQLGAQTSHKVNHRHGVKQEATPSAMGNNAPKGNQHGPPPPHTHSKNGPQHMRNLEKAKRLLKIHLRQIGEAANRSPYWPH